MRRNTLRPGGFSHAPLSHNRKQRTLIQTEFSKLASRQQSLCQQTQNEKSENLVQKLIREAPKSRFRMVLNQQELDKIVDKTMEQWINLLHNQNWQSTNNGPFTIFTQRLKNAQLKPDQEPEAKIFDPIMGIDKRKKQKDRKTQSQKSLQLSRLRFHSKIKSRKSIICTKRMSNASIPTHQSIILKQNSLNNKPKLVPLKLEKSTETPEGSTRRNLEDFLREKKINDEINLGYTIKFFQQKENHNLKVSQEVLKSSFMVLSSKNQSSSGENLLKLPLISNAKEECSMDYDGSCIPLKKVSKLKQPAQILKPQYKIKNQANNKGNVFPHKPKISKPKLSLLSFRNSSINLSDFSTLLTSEQDLKTIIEQNFKTDRVKFRQMDPEQVTAIYD